MTDSIGVWGSVGVQGALKKRGKQKEEKWQSGMGGAGGQRLPAVWCDLHGSSRARPEPMGEAEKAISPASPEVRGG